LWVDRSSSDEILLSQMPQVAFARVERTIIVFVQVA
jgi:hypothetical protein